MAALQDPEGTLASACCHWLLQLIQRVGHETVLTIVLGPAPISTQTPQTIHPVLLPNHCHVGHVSLHMRTYQLSSGG